MTTSTAPSMASGMPMSVGCGDSVRPPHLSGVRQRQDDNVLQQHVLCVAGTWFDHSFARGLATGFGAYRGLIYGGGLAIFLANYSTYWVNGGCHKYGKRDFNTDDVSTNFWLGGSGDTRSVGSWPT